MSHVSVFISPAPNPTAMTPSAIFIHNIYLLLVFIYITNVATRHFKTAAPHQPSSRRHTLKRVLGQLTPVPFNGPAGSVNTTHGTGGH